ncbi:MAG: C25 family cysteine peptidase [Candidatus Hodarchaeota archaeon]
MELIISSKKKLIDKYGFDNFWIIDTTLHKLMSALKNDGLDSELVYIDDRYSLSPFRLQPVDPENPEKIKKLLDNIQERIESYYSTIEYFLLIGGDDIVPFYRVPNPVYDPNGDPDKEIYSDSPYASTDDEFLVPERAIGRIPDSNSNDPQFLVSQIENIINSHTGNHKSGGNFGYSAEVWKEASKDVYQAMGRNQRLTYSPPTIARTLQKNLINQKKLLYFNLHGNDKTASWYGQPRGRSTLTVAFTANQLETIDVEQAIVFSEACYGAHILGKGLDTSIPLKFLEQKAECFVGSTMIAYGSLVPPISAADVLAKYFFQYVKDGLPYGIAFLNAKKDYAKKMIRLGLFHVDEVDAKTLLEFVLYGDPSLTWEKKESELEVVETRISNGVTITYYRRR